ncbi:DedA family protein [Nonomuraea angiospora]|uniref:Membrane protein DedA with SNARE-associated domain n=1 Tax=Nonomuraea angiospora TaxID=46172 RepID=A0ABR9MGZ6_9ACTN|nr:DedA family protein [Nonomuraea angiospora]MBE1592178.1 membrane protein DedA with SNARE-associated domain [Nonomuraea angiospora]
MIAPLSVVLPALTVLWGLRGASGYLTIAALVLLENFGIPVPGETALIAGAAYAGHGHLNIVAVAVVAFIAAVIGDNIGYAIGRSAGRRLVTRYGRYLLLPPARFARAEQFVTRHGPEIIIAARFIEGLRQLNGIIAGTTAMPWRRFLAYNVLGAALWVAVWAALGNYAGHHLATIEKNLRQYQWYAIAALALLAGAYAGLHILRRRRNAHHEPPRT